MHRLLFPILLMTALCSCKKEPADAALEAMTGGQVDRDGKTLTFKGKDGEKITTRINDDGDSVATVTNAEGETATVGFGKLPDGFPLPVFEGAQVAMAVGGKKDGARSYALTFSAPAKAEVVGAFYEKALKDKGLTVKKVSHAMGDSQMVVLTGTGGEAKKTASSVNITGTEDEGSMVQLTWSEPE